jgi:phage tail-like protein
MAAPALTATGLELRLGGREPVELVCRLAGLESATRVTEHAEVDRHGNPELRKVPGATYWPELVVTRQLDASRELWDWRQTVLQSGADRALRDGTVALLDAEGRELAMFAFSRGWPCVYRITGFELPAAPVLEEVVICHEGLARV